MLPTSSRSHRRAEVAIAVMAGSQKKGMNELAKAPERIEPFLGTVVQFFLALAQRNQLSSFALSVISRTTSIKSLAAERPFKPTLFFCLKGSSGPAT